MDACTEMDIDAGNYINILQAAFQSHINTYGTTDACILSSHTTVFLHINGAHNTPI